ncbi:hypothetical protein [Flavobacterium sp.]|uniref:hypothetical protein n=1 Tax=Flavobacterium sp. TaxID=239 RepID=UPI002619CF65|nr:hypothetical protein [Flavobacterium sp.]
MKKLFFTLFAVIGFATTSNAQCNEQSTLLTNACGSWCVSVEIPYTGYLEVDVANLIKSNGTMRRKPNVRELLAVSNALCE